MSSDKKRYIVYTNFGESLLPILCSSIENNDFKDNTVTLKNVIDLKFNVYPDIQIEHIIVPKSMISYFLIGNKTEHLDNEESNEGLESNFSKTDDSQGSL
jgi:hypothetical protein